MTLTLMVVGLVARVTAHRTPKREREMKANPLWPKAREGLTRWTTKSWLIWWNRK